MKNNSYKSFYKQSVVVIITSSGPCNPTYFNLLDNLFTFYSSFIFYALVLFKFVHLLRATNFSVETVVCYPLEIKLLIIIMNFIAVFP